MKQVKGILFLIMMACFFVLVLFIPFLIIAYYFFGVGIFD
jgi:hypothetical protein